MFTLNCRGRLLVLEKPVVMGILNLTPDSFYPGSRYENTDSLLKKAEQMLKDGAAMLDIGGQSTRPGSTRISEREELSRVVEPIRKLSLNFPEAFISVDTFYPEVARQAVEAGASIVNDISAGSMDAGMAAMVASLEVPYVLMHMKGTPQTMQAKPEYEDVTREVLDFLIWKSGELRKAGIRDLLIDPGFGFGKTAAHNFTLLRDLAVFRILESPVLLGVSRKSFIYKTLGVPIEDALNGTTVLHTIGLMNGATILRAHDVKEAVEVIRLWQACHPAGSSKSFF